MPKNKYIFLTTSYSRIMTELFRLVLFNFKLKKNGSSDTIIKTFIVLKAKPYIHLGLFLGSYVDVRLARSKRDKKWQTT